MEEIAEKFAAYLSHKMPQASAMVVEGISRIHGGASRETYRLTARWQEGGKEVSRPLILRRDPVASLIETERDLEFNAYRAFYPTGVPVPEPLFLETDEKWLERSFFVMEQIEGCQAASPFSPDPYGELAPKIGPQFFTILGKIAAQDPGAIGLGESMEKPAPEECWKRELDYWEGEIDKDTLIAQPIAKGAIRWLRRNPPPPPKELRVVHGDYRTGNFLFNDAGEIKSILDWEMCHLGDPLEDLAWACDPLWAFENEEKPGGLLPRAEALKLWEEASGLTIDPKAFAWWEIFAMVKGLAIWISAGKEYQAGNNTDPVMALSSWYCTDVHNRLLSKRMQEIAEEEAA